MASNSRRYNLRHTRARARAERRPDAFEFDLRASDEVPDIEIVEQSFGECAARLAAYIIGYEYKKANREATNYIFFTQQIVDHLWRDIPANDVIWYKRIKTRRQTQVQKCEQDDPDAAYYIISGLDALQYAAHNEIALESDYQYVGGIQKLQEIPKEGFKVRVKVTEVVGHDQARQELSNGHPIIAYVKTCKLVEEFRGEGVFKEHSPTITEGHIVTIVGFGVDAVGAKYYKVRNTWGLRWGSEGYGKILCDLVDPQGFVSGFEDI